MLECKIPLMDQIKYSVLDDPFFQPYVTENDKCVEIELVKISEDHDENLARAINCTNNLDLCEFSNIFYDTPIMVIYKSIILAEQFNQRQEMTYEEFWTFLSIGDIIGIKNLYKHHYYQIAIGCSINGHKCVVGLFYVPATGIFFVRSINVSHDIQSDSIVNMINGVECATYDSVYFQLCDMKKYLDVYVTRSDFVANYPISAF